MSEKQEIKFVQIGMRRLPNDSQINDPIELQKHLQATGAQDVSGTPVVDSTGTLRFETVAGTKG